MFKFPRPSVGTRKLVGLTLVVAGILVMYFGAAFSAALAGLFTAGAGFLIAAYGTFCTSNVIGEHSKKKEENLEQKE